MPKPKGAAEILLKKIREFKKQGIPEKLHTIELYKLLHRNPEFQEHFLNAASSRGILGEMEFHAFLDKSLKYWRGLESKIPVEPLPEKKTDFRELTPEEKRQRASSTIREIAEKMLLRYEEPLRELNEEQRKYESEIGQVQYSATNAALFKILEEHIKNGRVLPKTENKETLEINYIKDPHYPDHSGGFSHFELSKKRSRKT